MTRQRNVQQQNANAQSEMRETAVRFEAGATPQWIPSLLSSKAINLSQGSLVELREVPDQAGWLFYGTWSSIDGRSWEFDVLSSRDRGDVLDVFRFEEVTAQVLLGERLPGIGKSKGQLALEVTLERHAAGAGSRAATSRQVAR